MHNPATAKCACDSCGTHLEFPLELEGNTINCPHCGQSTSLREDQPSAATASPLTIADIVTAFPRPIHKPRVSFLYTINAFFVMCAMVLLPVLYVALIGLAGFGVWLWATHFRSLLTFGHGGGRLYILQVLLYIAPLLAGSVVVLFMLKPLFARRPPRAQPLAMNPAAEPLLYAFIHELARAVGAPVPRRVDLDCQLNASAAFRRGALSMFGNDFVLTLGLPLIAGLSTRQLAGVIAHEFGHFAQGVGMRLTYVIRSVNAWFARVAYERDAWDEALEDWAAETEDTRMAIIVGFVRFSVWSSRLVLKALMYVGHGFACMLLRQMEYDADTYEIKLVGSACFEETSKRIHVLGHVLEQTYKAVRPGWNMSRELPDDFPEYLLNKDAALPLQRRTQLEDTMGLDRTGLFDTHPSWGDRIRCARKAQEPGIFTLDAPAAQLFSNFGVLSRQITFLHYTDDLGIPEPLIKFVPVTTAGPDTAPHEPVSGLGHAPNPGPLKLRLPS